MAREKRSTTKPKLIIRNAGIKDVSAIVELSKKVYPEQPPYSQEMMLGQMNSFPEGQFVAEYEGRIVGYCSTFIVDENLALKPHTWKEITGNGFASKHDPTGDFLYGLDVFVDPEIRGMRIGQRLYRARKKLCKQMRLKGIVFGGRIPDYKKRAKKFDSAEDYVKKVKSRKIRDQVLSFQLRNGFEIQNILEDYLPTDYESMGYAVHLVWRNPSIDQSKKVVKTDNLKIYEAIRVGVVQYELRRVSSFEQFEKLVEYFVDVVADYKGDFVVFPELFPRQLLSMETRKLTTSQSIAALTQYTEDIKKMFHNLSLRYNINIVGGTHPTQGEDGKILNICYVYLRDGSIYQQTKIHPTPNERFWWNVEGGSKVQVIPTDCGPIGILICYDCEFPELARYLVDQGAKILFVPFCTDEKQSYLRVRYCGQARAVENQCYVVMAGNVGNLPSVENLDIQYAQSCILTPCDFPFARDGIAAETTPNVETVAFADLRMDILNEARNNGTVLNLKDRRFDLYGVDWRLK